MRKCTSLSCLHNYILAYILTSYNLTAIQQHSTLLLRVNGMMWMIEERHTDSGNPLHTQWCSLERAHIQIEMGPGNGQCVSVGMLVWAERQTMHGATRLQSART